MGYRVTIELSSTQHLSKLFFPVVNHFAADDRLLTAVCSDWLYVENPFGRELWASGGQADQWVGFKAMISVEVVNVLVHPNAVAFSSWERVRAQFQALLKAWAASAPTKCAEFLGYGVPCLGTAGEGDMVHMPEGVQRYAQIYRALEGTAP